MKTIFTCDTKTKRLSPAAYDSILAVIQREGYKALLGLSVNDGLYSTSIMVEGDVDAVLFCSKIARSYNQKSLIIVNESGGHVYDLVSQQMTFSGLWVELKHEPKKDHCFFNGLYYQIKDLLPLGVRTWN